MGEIYRKYMTSLDLDGLAPQLCSTLRVAGITCSIREEVTTMAHADGLNRWSSGPKRSGVEGGLIELRKYESLNKLELT